eukprot:253855-Lingulodinium_polyedra.AAC.1
MGSERSGLSGCKGFNRAEVHRGSKRSGCKKRDLAKTKVREAGNGQITPELQMLANNLRHRAHFTWSGTS